MKCNEKEWCYQPVRKETWTQRTIFKKTLQRKNNTQGLQKLERKEHPKGQREPAPTNVPIWMDDALMSVPFSSLPAPGLTKGGQHKWTQIFHFLSPLGSLFFCWNFFFPGLTTPSPLSPSYLQTTCLCTKKSQLSPVPTHTPIAYLYINQFEPCA